MLEVALALTVMTTCCRAVAHTPVTPACLCFAKGLIHTQSRPSVLASVAKKHTTIVLAQLDCVSQAGWTCTMEAVMLCYSCDVRGTATALGATVPVLSWPQSCHGIALMWSVA